MFDSEKILSLLFFEPRAPKMALNAAEYSALKLLLTLVLVVFNQSVSADWKDLLNIFNKSDTSAPAAGGISALSNTEIVDGLKQALIKGTGAAVTYLGKKDGFLSHPDVRIPMPDTLKTIESGLRRIGQGKVADSFVETMNRAAEQAVPVAEDVFKDSVRTMSIYDARNILTGPDDAATQYFRRTGGDSLKKKFLPIVKNATDNVNLTAKYKKLVGKLGSMSGFVDKASLDLDGYITDKAMDGLFLMVAREEKKIRENPVERTTDLLKKVFAAAK